MTSTPDLLQPEFQTEIAPRLAEQLPHLRVLVLFGSRARGQATAQSDWDLGILTQPTSDSSATPWSQFAIDAILAEILKISSDRIDIVNLQYCSPLLGYIVAREGKLLYEAEPGLFHRFQLKAWKIYADTAKLRRYQEDYIRRTLERLRHDSD